MTGPLLRVATILAAAQLVTNGQDVYPKDARCPDGTHVETVSRAGLQVNTTFTMKTPFGKLGPDVGGGVTVAKPGNTTQVCVPDDPNQFVDRSGPDIGEMTDAELDNLIRQAQLAVDDAKARMELIAEQLSACWEAQSEGHPKTVHQPEGPGPGAGMCRDCVDCSDLVAEYEKARQLWGQALERLAYLLGQRANRRR